MISMASLSKDPDIQFSLFLQVMYEKNHVKQVRVFDKFQSMNNFLLPGSTQNSHFRADQSLL